MVQFKWRCSTAFFCVSTYLMCIVMAMKPFERYFSCERFSRTKITTFQGVLWPNSTLLGNWLWKVSPDYCTFSHSNSLWARNEKKWQPTMFSQEPVEPAQVVCMESFRSQTLGKEKVIKEQLEMANEYANWAKEQGPTQFWLSHVSDTNYFGRSYSLKTSA